MPPDPRVHVGVAGLLKRRPGSLLMLRRSETASHGAGLWSVPGGWIDYGEDPRDALRREFLEETGVHVWPQRLLKAVTNTYPDQGLHVVCLGYKVVLMSGSSYSDARNVEPDKHSEMAWRPTDEVMSMDEAELFPPFRELRWWCVA